MRTTPKIALLVFLSFGLTAGKKSKEQPAPAPAPVAEEAAEEAPEPAEEAEPEPQSAAPNADFNAKLVHADGSTTSGQVVRVERSEDWFAEEGWTDQASKLTVTVEGQGTEKDVEWSAIKSIDIAYLGKANIDCTYDSDYTPLMWGCTMQTKSTVTLAEGGTWGAASRHKWKFVFADGKVEEFWIHKITARKQEDSVADINSADKSETVNAELQVGLQDAVIAASTSTAMKRIEITAR